MAIDPLPIHSPNLNAHSNFPYLMLHIKNQTIFPQNKGFNLMHWHSDIQFIYVLKGQIEVTFLEHHELISENNGLFINQNVAHLVSSTGDTTYKSILFPIYMVNFYENSPAEHLSHSLITNTQLPFAILGQDQRWSSSILCHLKKLIQLETSHSLLYPYQVLHELSGLWLDMLTHIEAIPPRLVPPSILSQRTQKCLAYIHHHYAETITLKDIAYSSHISESECLRCFKATLQTTPYQYLLAYRITKACDFLKHTANPISQIAQESGFNQQAYFTKCFKQHIGLTPSQFRKQSALDRSS